MMVNSGHEDLIVFHPIGWGGEKRMKEKALIAAAFFLPVAAAHAAFIRVDTALGPATGVIDTSTNLEWLKVSATAGLTPRPADHWLVREVPERSIVALIGLGAMALLKRKKNTQN
jgi:hypothetical protein